MSSISPVQTEESLSDLLDRVVTDRERITFVRDGREVAALVPIEDLELLDEIEDILDLEEIRASRKEAEEKGTIPLREIAARLGL